MKKKVLLPLAGLCVFMLLLFNSCVKDLVTPDEPNETGNGRFTWTKGGSVNIITATDAYVVAAYNEIYASRAGGEYVDIILDDLSQGSYTISASSGRSLEYSDGKTTFTGQSGYVVISDNTGITISGNFSCTLSGGGSISGEFSHLPKK
jgi:hypothetical protein